MSWNYDDLLYFQYWSEVYSIFTTRVAKHEGSLANGHVHLKLSFFYKRQWAYSVKLFCQKYNIQFIYSPLCHWLTKKKRKLQIPRYDQHTIHNKTNIYRHLYIIKAYVTKVNKFTHEVTMNFHSAPSLTHDWDY